MKKVKIILGVLIAAIIVILLAYYTTNESFRNYIQFNIFRKQVTENSSNVIELSSDDNPKIFAYSDYIGVLSKNILTIYSSNLTVVQELTIGITAPIIETSGPYVVIAEDGGSKFFVINSTNIGWQGKVDGEILKVTINKNGYVSVVASNSTYNSIVILFNSNGEELFKTYMPSTYAMCSAISNNNSYLAIGEIDYSGTVLKSYVRIMDIDMAETVYTYTADNNNIITNMKYYDKENVICEFTDSVVSISPVDDEEIYAVTDNTCFVDISLTNSLAILEKQSSGLFSYEYDLKLISMGTNEENIYILSSSMPKSISVSGKLIALNYGNEVDIINKKGSLKKNYVSNQQIKDVVVGDDIAGIIYTDKIEVLDI